MKRASLALLAFALILGTILPQLEQECGAATLAHCPIQKKLDGSVMA